MKEQLSSYMQTLGFSDLEQKIYLTLLKNGNMSVYQLAKKIDISRSSIYNAIEHMLEKGMVELCPGETAIYQAQKYDVLLEKLKKDFLESASKVDEMLSQYESQRYREDFFNIKDFSTILMKVKDILKNSDREVYINTDMSLDVFKEEFGELKKKNIRVVVYSFYDIGESSDYELYTHGRQMNGEGTRLMIVADDEITLSAGSDSEGNWQGTITGNKLFVKILSEHIHNDIYLLKLRDAYGREIYDQIHINTEYERRNR